MSDTEHDVKIDPDKLGVDEEYQRSDDFLALAAHAHNGIGFDTARIAAQEGRYGSNGGVGCDVRRGPCSCGAWH